MGEHPADEAILAYLESRQGVEAVETHLALCPECRRTLSELEALRQGPPRRSWIWAAAAASILAAVLLWPKREPVALPGPILPAPSSILAGRSVLVTLAEGASARVADARILLDRGMIRIESPGERVTLEAGSLRVVLDEGDLLASVVSGRADLLREAWGAEEVRITLRKGTARVGDRVLKPGESLGPPLSWSEEGWKPSPDLLPSPPARFLFEALVRKRQESAEVSAVFSGREAPIGANLLRAGEGWSRLRISVDASRCLVRLGSRTVADLAPSELARKLPPGQPGAGIRAFGGVVEVKDARWRPLP